MQGPRTKCFVHPAGVASILLSSELEKQMCPQFRAVSYSIRLFERDFERRL